MNPAAGDMTNISRKRDVGVGSCRAGTRGMGCLWWRRVERVSMPPMESPEREIWVFCEFCGVLEWGWGDLRLQLVGSLITREQLR